MLLQHSEAAFFPVLRTPEQRHVLVQELGQVEVSDGSQHQHVLHMKHHAIKNQLTLPAAAEAAGMASNFYEQLLMQSTQNTSANTSVHNVQKLSTPTSAISGSLRFRLPAARSTAITARMP